MKVQVLGAGCKKCNLLYQNLKSFIEKNHIDAQGKEVFRHIGFFPKDQILKKFEELGMSLNKED
jgi:hypothetical protein